MPKIQIGNFKSGLTLNRQAFNIADDAWAYLFNFYVWRGRMLRKRGTGFLGQLQRQIVSATMPTVYQKGALALTAGVGNLISGFSLEPTSTIAPGSISVVVGGSTYTESPARDGTLLKNGVADPGSTINYATGSIVIASGGTSLTGTFSYYPGLPVMGLKDFSSSATTAQFPFLLAFDTTYSYQVNQAGVPFFYNVNFFKNSQVPFVWSGGDSNQFWTTNYPATNTSISGALWATNNTPGLNLLNGTYVSGSPGTTIVFNFVYPTYVTGAGTAFLKLVVGDQLWFNEWPTTGGNNINGKMGTVTNISAGGGTYTVTFTTSTTVSGTGIVQMLSNTLPGQDGIKWYDGDPTGGNGIPAATGLGWVNFAPPLTALTVSIDGTPPLLYYLVGALAIVPFKDYLLFFSPYIQSSSTAPIQLQDVVIWSQNGTPFYTPPVPKNQTFSISAYYVDQTGLADWLSAGISQPIRTVSNNEDVLIVGFGGDGRKTRFVYTGNGLQPFLFFNINSELPSSSTFSAVALDKGVLDIGQYGLAMTDQQSSQRVDLDIPDSIFQIQNLNNGPQRVNAIRDFFREWIYFTYPTNIQATTISRDPTLGFNTRFPTQTFLFNYRDNTWSILYENFTAHGRYRAQKKKSWATIGKLFGSWANWREPWNSGLNSALQTNIIAGNPQGYVLIKDIGTSEAISGTILNASGPLTITGITNASPTVITVNNNLVAGQAVLLNGVLGMIQVNGQSYTVTAATPTTITITVDSTAFGVYAGAGTVQPYIYSIDHCVSQDNGSTGNGDYLYFTNAIGLTGLNTTIGQVVEVFDINNFLTDNLLEVTGTYLGLGNFTRLSQPIFLSKQFSYFWDEGRQIRLGVQKYLLDKTNNGQVTLNIYLGQDQDFPYNFGPIVPSNDSENSTLVYSDLIYTCPELTNLAGITAANVNLQQMVGPSAQQLWHRMNTSLIGSSFQISLTLSDAQMRNFEYVTSEIGLHSFILDANPGPSLS